MDAIMSGAVAYESDDLTSRKLKGWKFMSNG
jgi:hypothetical protein